MNWFILYLCLGVLNFALVRFIFVKRDLSWRGIIMTGPFWLFFWIQILCTWRKVNEPH